MLEQHLRCTSGVTEADRVELGHSQRSGPCDLAAELPLVMLGAIALPAHEQLATRAGASLSDDRLDLVCGHSVRVTIDGRRLML